MWQIVQDASDTASDFSLSLRDLLETTTRSLIVTVGVLWLGWQIVATAVWPGRFDWQTWPITMLLGLVATLTWVLLPRHLRTAQLLWLAGLTGLILLGLHWFRQPSIALLLPLVPFMAIVLVNVATGVLCAAVGMAGLWWVSTLAAEPLADPLAGPFFTTGHWLLVGVASVVVGLIAWAASRSLLTVAQWSLRGFANALQHTEEARQHRAQMARLYKDLDQAYYQLERANAALVAARKSAEDAERFKTEFVTNVSHELRTPLNLIVGFSEMMMTSPESYGGAQLPGAYRSDLHSVYHSAQHLLALVDDVLDLARIEVGRIALAREEVDLRELVGEAVRMVRDYVSAKGLELRLDIAPDLPTLWLDRLRIRQVLLNLLVNAARHTERGWIGVTVQRHPSPHNGDGEELVLRVTDTGHGIEPDDLAQIFEEFRTTEQPFTEWHSGTGLGLPISKKFVELHRGRMGVESTPGEGTTFWFTLPCAPAAREGSAPAPQPESRTRYRPLVRLGTSERIVVVVHDDPGVVTLLKRYVDGYQLVAAPTLAEGVHLARETQATALVVDHTKSESSAQGQGVIVPSDLLVVRCALPSVGAAAASAGVAALLVKPVARQELLSAVDRLDRLDRPIEHVLIVDDDAEVVRLFRRMLRARVPAHNVTEAYNGAEALAQMRQKRPDLVLLDLVMPEVDGRGVLECMAREPELADIPVIMVSAHGQDHVNMRLRSPVRLERGSGFELGETVQMFTMLFNALAPGWQSLDASEPTPAAAPPESPAWADNPPPPASPPAAAR